MSRLSRYVLFEVMKVFLLTLAGMTMIMIIAGALNEAVRQGLGVSPVVRIVPYVLPDALRFAVPGTILFAVCSVYGRISAANEVVAVKSMGLSPMVVVWPTLIFAFFISLVAVWLNDVAVSWGRKGVQKVVLQSLEQIVYGMLRTQQSYSNDKFSITVVDVDEDRLIYPTLTFFGADKDSTLVLKAHEAQLHFDADGNTLEIGMLNGRVLLGDRLRYEAPGHSIERVPLVVNQQTRATKPSHCALRNIPGEVDQQNKKIEELEQTYAAEAGFALLGGDFKTLGNSVWQQRAQGLQSSRDRLFRLHTEPWRRWANGFSCFFFVLVGIPLAIRLRNSDFWTSFGLCFLPILFAYYPLLAVGVDRAKAGELPPYAVWLGNLVLLLAGLQFMKKVLRH